MKFIALLLAFILLTATAFAALNWPTLVAPTAVSIGVAEFNAPLGLLMFGVLALLTVLFLVFVVYLQTTLMLATRRHAQELQDHRKLATQAETSRFTELRNYLEKELARQSEAAENTRAEMLNRLELVENALLGRLDEAEKDLLASVEQSGNTLTAYIGELEDRLDTEKRREQRESDTESSLLPEKE
ncbi:hypothetical protein [Desulfurivibrio alkaliphilus]|uniref:Signal transduction histidine kinase n=1 Tax=Desulfurivibrio alkaliphilus (strain DSM 19089 / UNIQEM U267 / AHT2) TaxID=589865 RepID=D6Z1G7_DESAT|nr:hypothetical protein [Desulfurivibrio alkaliphilus]ADH85422.1 conserved hypothetical protein [Desulfurivibrio alkaliphilus AHT 2]